MDFAEFKSGHSLEAAATAGYLSDREKQLIALAVVATRGCIACSGARIKRALASGIPREAVIQAIDVAASINAGVTLATALQGADREAVDDACTTKACTGT